MWVYTNHMSSPSSHIDALNPLSAKQIKSRADCHNSLLRSLMLEVDEAVGTEPAAPKSLLVKILRFKPFVFIDRGRSLRLNE